MKALMLVTLSLAMGFVGGCSKQSNSQTVDPNEQLFKSYDFPSHDGLTFLCQRQSKGAGCDFTVEVLLSASSPSELLADYREKLGDARFSKTQNGEGGVWRHRSLGTRIHILPIGTERIGAERLGDLDVTCSQTPSANSRSRIVLLKGGCIYTGEGGPSPKQ